MSFRNCFPEEVVAAVDCQSHAAEVLSKMPPQRFPALADEVREVVPTDCAAFHLNRRPQTLRLWACYETGPIRPVRVNGRLGWRVAEIRRLLGAAE